MKVSVREFGRMPEGEVAMLFTFDSINGMKVSITNLGGIITSIKTPDKTGHSEEITAGFDNLEAYLKGHPYFGTIAGRYANRIGSASFKIDKTNYILSRNDGLNQLHGGINGFHTKLWQYQLIEEENQTSLELSYTSPHLEEGFPGNLATKVTYTIKDANEILIRFEATTDKSTHVNLTNHAYFNLGSFRGNIHDHHLKVDATSYVDVDASSIPTGKLIRLQNSKMNLAEGVLLGDVLSALPGGIDHCFVLNQLRNVNNPIARLSHKPSGRRLTVYTTQPGIQVYTGNSLDGSLTGHKGATYHRQWALCLETQHFPDSPNQPMFPTTLLKPTEKYDHTARYVFGLM